MDDRKESCFIGTNGELLRLFLGIQSDKHLPFTRRFTSLKKQKNGSIDFVLQPNKHTNTLFIVDEASMIPDQAKNSTFFEHRSLLDDLISYVYSGNQCKLIFIGDTAQLPPVKLKISPALDSDRLTLDYHKNVKEIELDEVTRQHDGSGILANARSFENSR